MCGRIGFAWLNGAQLDSDAKQWRLFADVLNDAAIFLELLSQVSRDKCVASVSGRYMRAGRVHRK